MTHGEQTPDGGQLTESSPVLGPEQRARILSTARLKLVLTAFVAVLLLGASALSFALVSRIFDQLTPATARDLQWKAQRGAAELAHRSELAMVMRDAAQIRSGLEDYIEDADVEAVIVADAEGQVLLDHRRTPGAADLFQGMPGQVTDRDGSFVAWVETAIEGEPVGRVAVAVSQSRLRAGEELRRHIIQVGAGGAILALFVSLLFVNLYIGPLVRMTESAFTVLEKKTHEALEATRLKSEFLANMSHEIRTPMNGVVGMTQLLRGTRLGVQQRRYANAIQTSVDALLTLINDVLDVSTIEAGRLQVRDRSCDVLRLVEDVTELAAPAATAKGLEVACHVAVDMPEIVRCDRHRVRQVLTNILGNAVKFTERGHVEVRARWLAEGSAERSAERGAESGAGGGAQSSSEGAIEISVEDTGVGIAPEHQSLVFGQFSQVDGSLTRRYGGAGLGLAISKKLVELMGGTLSVESRLDEGSTFSFTIPVRKPTRARLAPRFDSRVLLVEPGDLARSTFMDLLEGWNVAAVSRSRAREALDTAREAAEGGQPFRLCFVAEGASTPNLDLARELEKLEPAPRIVLLREFGAERSATDDGFVAKPLRQEDVRRILERVSAGKRNLAPAQGEASAERPPRVFTDGPKVLVVEDNPVNQRVMESMLAELGVTCDVCSDGQAGLEALERGEYPLVLMDCQMPVLDGYEATRRLRRWEGPKARTPVIAVTAHAFEGERDKAEAAGMDGYLTKPFTLVGLLESLEGWLGAATEREAPPSSGAAARRATDDGAGDGRAGERRAGEPSAKAVESPEVSESKESAEPPLDPGFRRSAAVAKLFVQLSPDQVASVRTAVEAGDPDEQKAHAHRLKGSCYAIGAKRMAGVCAQLETANDGSTELVERLELELAAVLDALQADVAAPPRDPSPGRVAATGPGSPLG